MKIILFFSLLLSLSAFADDNTVQPTPSDNGKKTEELNEDIKGTIVPSSPDKEKQLEENKRVHEDHLKNAPKGKAKGKVKNASKSTGKKTAKKAGKKAKAKAKKKSKQ